MNELYDIIINLCKISMIKPLNSHKKAYFIKQTSSISGQNLYLMRNPNIIWRWNLATISCFPCSNPNCFPMNMITMASFLSPLFKRRGVPSYLSEPRALSSSLPLRPLIKEGAIYLFMKFEIAF